MQGMKTLQTVRERNTALSSPATFVISTSWHCHAVLNATQAFQIHGTCSSILHNLFTHHATIRDTWRTDKCRTSRQFIKLVMQFSSFTVITEMQMTLKSLEVDLFKSSLLHKSNLFWQSRWRQNLIQRQTEILLPPRDNREAQLPLQTKKTERKSDVSQILKKKKKLKQLKNSNFNWLQEAQFFGETSLKLLLPDTRNSTSCAWQLILVFHMETLRYFIVQINQ